ncbi:MAG: AAA family ATPase [Chitinophagaceae bacterium]|nr:AAA family ATPase [Chitinophagaceae bacterium]
MTHTATFLERDPFLATLQQGFDQTAAGEGHCFFVAGEAGIGKSSLVKLFLQQAEGRCRQYTALCDFLFTPRPLGPLYDFALQADGAVLEQMNTASSRSALFAAMTQELTRHQQPVVVVIEDIHWADEATLDFIKFFARRIPGSRCMMLLTYRDNEIGPAHPLRNVLGELNPGSFSRITLTPLSKEAVETLAQQRGYNGEDVYQVTGGNPFYVNEIIASYSPGIPENIKDSVLSVYNRQAAAIKHIWQVLSIMPEGLELGWLSEIDANGRNAIESCLLHGVLLIRGSRIVFKHELYRRTIETALSPFKRQELNKQVLDFFLDRFRASGAVERIVHYAKNASENELVDMYAPQAAEQAAAVGAHTEAAKLYGTAIEYNTDKDPDKLVRLYEAYTYECYLINQISEAIIYQTRALKIWQDKNEALQTGNSLRFLSRLWWFQGHRREAEAYAEKAIRIFEGLPASKEKAMAFSNMAQLKMLAEDLPACVEWGTRAIELSKQFNDPETLSHALNNVGTVKMKFADMREEGRQLLLQSLNIALEHSFHEHAARAYTNLIASAIGLRDYETAAGYLQEGLQYCEERDLHSWIRYKLVWKAKMLLYQGHWTKAREIAVGLLANPTQPGIIRVAAMVVDAIVRMRTGTEEAAAMLREAKELASATQEHQRIIPVMIALLEYQWLTGIEMLDENDLELTYTLLAQVDNVHLNIEAAFWLQLARPEDPRAQEWWRSFQPDQSNEGKTQVFQKWALQPYERALLLQQGSEQEQKEALQLLQQLGAEIPYRQLRQAMRSAGIRSIPRGMRETTRSNPAQLTPRELDILTLLRTGAQNKEIAAALFISPKTVDHHISSILFKLEAPSRTRAVIEAERLGVLK